YQIAAAHGRGITQLLDLTLQPVIAELAAEEDELAQDDADLAELYLEGEEGAHEDSKTGFEDKPVKLAIIGRPNVVKSTLTNRILGEER
ncbi:ribosome biogenesis GTPase Der, partial [Pseudoalteromonas sp. S3178]